MSILIKGMKMPISCSSCPLCYDMMECSVAEPMINFFKVKEKEFDFCTERHPRCPLVEVDDNEIDDVNKVLKGVREASRIITEVFCRPPEVETNE